MGKGGSGVRGEEETRNKSRKCLICFEETIPFRRELLEDLCQGAGKWGDRGLQDVLRTNQQSILLRRRMNFALEHMAWERQGKPAVLRVLEVLGSRDQELL